MPLNFSSAHSSRITKKSQAKPPLLKRSSSSPFANFIRRKPIQRSKSKPESPFGDEDFFEDRLEDAGLVRTLATDLNLSDVAQIIQYVRMHMFDKLPESGGFNSTRIAEILNFRDSLPPTVTVTHVHALTHSPTTTEREISELTKAGVLRKLVIPGWGAGGSNIGEGLALTADIEKLMGCANDVDKSLASQFLADLAAKPLAQSVNGSSYTAARITELMRAGFLTSPSAISSPANLYTRPDSGSADIVTSISNISKAASGSLAAVGGEGAIYDAGGRGGMRRSNSHYETQHVSLTDATMLQFSLPGTGPYIRLLTSARSHLVSLIEKSRFREMPVYLLKERWDGGISADDPAAKAKKYRGEFAGTLPARTRKWKQFYGLSFGFVLAECLGAGLIELFDTETVGRAVRIV